MGLLFMVGAACFAAGSTRLFADAVGPSTTGTTFFVGSVFFTCAAALQYHETTSAPTGVDPASVPAHTIRALVGWTPRRIDWWAAAVQLIGTVFFNITTFAATLDTLSANQEVRLIWAPDVVGSVCFLVASWLAYAEVNRGVLPRPDRSTGWRISALNMAGSITFGVAAVASRFVGPDGEVANLTLTNLGTFVGALCFFFGAALLPVESARDRATATDPIPS
jgi:predicted membrane protein